MKKKIEIAKKLIEENLNVFRCPVCRQKMLLQEKSLLCTTGHCFDLSRNGYINLLKNTIHSKYDNDLFTARKTVLQNGFFEKLITEIGNFMLQTESIIQNQDLKILDAGCGEGTNLVNLTRYIRRHSSRTPVGIGLDISREGIHIASREFPGHIWSVADLANSPLNDKQFDFIINILSPANYFEFNRILKDNGFLIKVIPGVFYLQEIRKILSPKSEGKPSSNKEIINLFQKKFKIINQQHFSYQQEINNNDILPFIEMTPLSWRIKEKKVSEDNYCQINKITADFIILAGIKK